MRAAVRKSLQGGASPSLCEAYDLLVSRWALFCASTVGDIVPGLWRTSDLPMSPPAPQSLA